MSGWNRTRGALVAPLFLCRVGRPTHGGDPQSAAGRPTPRAPGRQGSKHDRPSNVERAGRSEGAGYASDRPASEGAGYASDRPASRGAGIYINIYRLAGAQAWRDAAGDAAGETANKILVMLARPV